MRPVAERGREIEGRIWLRLDDLGGGRYLHTPSNRNSNESHHAHPGVQETVSMKTTGGPPRTAVRSAVDHGVIRTEPQSFSVRRTAQWEPTTSVSMCIAGRQCS